jgi:thiamine transporter ThiT
MMFQTPAVILSLVLVSILAGFFYLWRGRSLRDLLFFWLAAAVGFASGQLAGQVWGFVPWTIGQVHVIEGTIVAVFFLGLANWLRQDRRP